jgi:hypothetical protein
MATLFREREARAKRNRGTQLAFYKHALGRAAEQRREALGVADECSRQMQQLLPGALQAGISVGEAAALTGLSRATLYRMVADSRHQNDLRFLAGGFEHALALLSGELDAPPLPADLQRYFGIQLDEVFDKLTQIYPLLSAEASALGPMMLALLGDLIPRLGTPEKVVLNMLIFQGLPVKEVARSTQLPEVHVLGWAALGLLRVLPDLRARVDGRAS